METNNLPLNLSDYQVAVIRQRLADVRSEKADYSPDLTDEIAIRDSCKLIGKFDGQIELLNAIIDEALTPLDPEDN